MEGSLDMMGMLIGAEDPCTSEVTDISSPDGFPHQMYCGVHTHVGSTLTCCCCLSCLLLTWNPNLGCLVASLTELDQMAQLAETGDKLRL